MTTLAQMLSQKREANNITLEKASKDLLIKREHLEALENSNWKALPEPPFVRGFIKNYADYLGLDASHLLALYRREYDPEKYPKSSSPYTRQRQFLTPKRIFNIIIVLIVAIFVIYLAVQYTSILKSPKLKVSTPPDDITTSTPVVDVSGQTEKETTISVNGEFAPVDKDGNFSYQLKLNDGQNIIEIIAAKRLSPKTKVTKIIRLEH